VDVVKIRRKDCCGKLPHSICVNSFACGLLRDKNPARVLPRPDVSCYWTVRVAVVEWFRLPLTPVMVMVRAPRVARLFTVTVRVEVPDPVMDAGLKVPVTREPSPLTLRLTVPVKLFTAPIVTV
jgi:hypothetical protein